MKIMTCFLVMVVKSILNNSVLYQVEEMAMIPAKEAKEMLYILFEHSMVTLIVSCISPLGMTFTCRHMYSVKCHTLCTHLL